MAHWLDVVVDILKADTSDLRVLARIAGYDPKIFYKGTSMDGLDLSSQDVSDLELEGIEDVSNFEEYTARKAKEYIVNDTDLPSGWGDRVLQFRASRRRLRNLSQLRAAPNLVDLRVSDTWISSLEPVRNCKKLERVYISGTAISDVSPLSEMTRLFDVDVSRTKISDISPLSGASPVHLDISNSQVDSISSLSVDRLWSFYMRETRVKDISVLGDAFRLRSLNISGSPIVDISCIRYLGNIRSIYANKTNIRDISPVAEKAVVEVLHLGFCEIDNFGSLSDVPGIRRLWLNNTNVVDLRFMSSIIGVADLNLSNTNVDDVSSLSALRNLRNLDLSNTRIDSINSILTVESIEELNISGTSVSSISGLSKCKSLRSLVIDGCDIVDLDELSGLDVRSLSMLGLRVGAEIFDILPRSLLSFDVSPNVYSDLLKVKPKEWSVGRFRYNALTFMRPQSRPAFS